MFLHTLYTHVISWQSVVHFVSQLAILCNLLVAVPLLMLFRIILVFLITLGQTASVSQTPSSSLDLVGSNNRVLQQQLRTLLQTARIQELRMYMYYNYIIHVHNYTVRVVHPVYIHVSQPKLLQRV